MLESVHNYLQEFAKRYQASTNEKEKIMQEKNQYIRKAIEKQIEEQGTFHIETPFGEKTCKMCGGTGEIYKFFRDVKYVACKTCNGKGNLEKPCLVCQGTGRYIREELPLRINVKCKRCDGLGKIYNICPMCKGTGKVRKHVIAPKIKSTTQCPACRGLGFYQEQKVQKQEFNPCVDSNVAEQLTQLVIPH